MNLQKVCENYLKDLPQRTADVIERRFGLKTGERETLEAIGQSYGITRERVRQIEREGFDKISPEIRKNKEVFSYFEKVLDSCGGLKEEQDLLDVLGEGKYQNQVFFLLTNSNSFKRVAEDDNFHTFWTSNKDSIEKAKKVINSTIARFKKDRKTLSLGELSKDKDVFASYIGISKKIEKNLEGKYGLSNWLEINPKGIKDKAYLALKKKEEPMHFTQIASLIEEMPFSNKKKVHTATVHNELIKDDRFILVGRGLYALREWGYETGVVKDIISKLLKQRPLTKEEIVSKVLEQRFVKENTVLLNLQDKKYFARDEKGRYNVREA